jgi:AcrR family transcriptional regulator
MVQAIRHAAAEVFAQRGYARTTTNRIAERAGVSVGSLYQYFPDKDSLLASLLEQHHTEVRRAVGAALVRLADDATPLEHGLEQLLSNLVAIHQANPSLTRALSMAVLRESRLGNEPQHGAHETEQDRQVSTVLAARPDVRSGDHVAMAAVLSQTMAHLTRWLVHDPPPGVAHTVLLREVIQLLLAYVKK